MSLNLDRFLLEFQKTAKELVGHDWGSSFFGNISIMIDEEDEFLRYPVISSFSSPIEEPEIEGRYLLITRTTSTMQEVADHPENAIGLYRIAGDSLDLLWGRGPPTSELSTHLLVHSSGKGSAIIHCHMPLLGSITHADLEGSFLPEGFSYVGEFEPGSIGLAEATKKSMERNHTVIWVGHGAVTYSDGLGRCLDRLYVLEDLLKEIHPSEDC